VIGAVDVPPPARERIERCC